MIIERRLFVKAVDKFSILILADKYNVGLKLDSDTEAVQFLTINGYSDNVTNFITALNKKDKKG
jgi:hypothetical protein